MHNESMVGHRKLSQSNLLYGSKLSAEKVGVNTRKHFQAS